MKITGDTYRAAARRLERTGWKRDDIGSAEGPNCMWGAVAYEARLVVTGIGLVHSNGQARDELRALVHVLEETYGDQMPHRSEEFAVFADYITTVNDFLIPDAETAARMLEKAAAYLEETA